MDVSACAQELDSHHQSGATELARLDQPAPNADLVSTTHAPLAAQRRKVVPASEVLADVRAVERSRLCQIVPAAALSALTRLPYYQVCKHPFLADLFVELTHECAAVARAADIEIGDYQGFNPRTLLTLPLLEAAAEVFARGQAMEAQGLTEMRISMLRDILRRRPTEVEETLGYVVRLATEYGVPVPLTNFTYGVICAIESYL